MARWALLVGAVLLASCGSAKVFDCSVDDCEDCAVLSVKLDWSSTTLAQCRNCQGAPQGSLRACTNFPVRDGKTVVHGCNVDSDCNGLSRFCGYSNQLTRHVCVISDAQ